ncbi:MAG: dihydrofolate reductase family protein [Chloroflexi bacterium]|nr:dihydrofolate reductase family protein [Chloroflexota bacterium]
MRKLIVFNHMSLDGYFTDSKSDMSFAHNPIPDAEWDAFVSRNAGSGGTLVFGRITYEMMASYWPTPMAAEQMPDIAERMNNLPKVVFSRTLNNVSWQNAKLVKGDMVNEVKRMKNADGADMAILGSGSVVSQLAQARLIDEYQFVMDPVVLGSGRTMFDGLKEKLTLRLKKSQTFANGNVLLSYEPAT